MALGRIEYRFKFKGAIIRKTKKILKLVNRYVKNAKKVYFFDEFQLFFDVFLKKFWFF